MLHGLEILRVFADDHIMKIVQADVARSCTAPIQEIASLGRWLPLACCSGSSPSSCAWADADWHKVSRAEHKESMQEDSLTAPPARAHAAMARRHLDAAGPASHHMVLQVNAPVNMPLVSRVRSPLQLA